MGNRDTAEIPVATLVESLAGSIGSDMEPEELLLLETLIAQDPLMEEAVLHRSGCADLTKAVAWLGMGEIQDLARSITAGQDACRPVRKAAVTQELRPFRTY